MEGLTIRAFEYECSYTKARYRNYDDERDKLTNTAQQLKEQPKQAEIFRIMYRKNQERNKKVENMSFEAEEG
jgi:hypothetical protein